MLRGKPRPIRLKLPAHAAREGGAGLAPDTLNAAEARSAIIVSRMSKVCSICGKKPGFGHNRSHSMVATKRRFNPNLQRVRMLLDGKPTRAYVCTRCLKAGKVTKAI
jgi:large subunit ribosomal protein L28